MSQQFSKTDFINIDTSDAVEPQDIEEEDSRLFSLAASRRISNILKAGSVGYPQKKEICDLSIKY